MQINKGRFLENGNSGYVLKPARMRDGGGTLQPVSVTLSVTVISCSRLPGVSATDTFDP